ncbi:MAG: alpha/beta hydrolase [Gemmatimonadaceae bacterium]
MNASNGFLRWAALAIAIITAFLASWIIIPAPTYFLLTFGVGAREVSAWLVLTSLLGIALALPGHRVSRVARLAMVLSLASLLVSLWPFAEAPRTIRRFDGEMSKLSSPPAIPLRSKPIVVADLFRGVHGGEFRATKHLALGAPGGKALTVDVYQPPQDGHYPIIVQIYGGAWQRGDPSSNSDFARWIASAGYVVFAIDYRHAPTWRWPAQIDDVDSALVWVREHATQYGGDTSRVVLIGRSAGAHLALMAAYGVAPPVSLRGVIGYYAPSNLVDAYKNPPHPDPLDVRSDEIALLGGTLEQMPARYEQASPLWKVRPGLPPTLLINGAADHVVEAKYGMELATRLRSARVDAAYLEIPWAEHAFDAVFQGPSSQLALYYTERFIAHVTR